MLMISLSDVLLMDQSIVVSMEKTHTALLDLLMMVITNLGNGGFIWIVMTIVLLLSRDFRRQGLLLAVGMIFSMLLGEGLLKHLFNRTRPFESIDDIDLLISAPITSSFPSGHTSSAFVFAFLFTWFFWGTHRYVVLFIWVTTCLMAYSRLYLQVHYPTDILAGILLGYVSYRLVRCFFQGYAAKKSESL